MLSYYAEFTMRAGWIVLAVIASSCIREAASERPLYFIHAPSIIRTDTNEPLSVAVQDVAGAVKVSLSIKNYPDMKTTFFETTVEVTKDAPVIINSMVASSRVPLPKNMDEKQFVYLVAKSDTPALRFQNEVRILLSRRSRTVYIQTDKPIYTPTQTIRMRMIPVGIDLKPFAATGLTVEIKNPDGKIVERYDRLWSMKGYISKSLTLGDTPLIGNWTVSALYENENTSVAFEVREYVLPRFSVKIEGPPYVLESDKYINVKITSSYVYGKPVTGSVILKLGVINDRNEVIHIANARNALKDGVASFKLSTNVIKDSENDIWFPDEDRLNLEASVQERTSGKIETSYDTSIRFSKTPYRITFKRSVTHFKPGLPYEINMDVRYPSNRPAKRKVVTVSGISVDAKKKESKLNSYNNKGYEAITDEDGRAKVIVDVPPDAIMITIKTKLGPDAGILDVYNKEVIHKVYPFESASKSYALIRSPEKIPKVGEHTEVEAFIVSSKAVSKLHYMVLARGKVIFHRIHKDPGAITALRFLVTQEMCPLIRLFVYYTIQHKTKTEIVSDYTVVSVKKEFKNKKIEIVVHLVKPSEIPVAQRRYRVSIETKKKEEIPGSRTVVTIKGTPNSHAAILAVDKSIYLLRNDHKLTQDVVFRGLKKFDLGCGYGGGKNSKDVFKNAGLTMISNTDLTPETRTDTKCRLEESSRIRRSVEDIKCCEEGKAARKSPKSCKVQALMMNLGEKCQRIFITCCKKLVSLGRSLVDEEDDDEIVEDDRKVQFRSNFPETWLYGDVAIGPTGVATLDVKLPDTITTWVLQAFATNKETGLGVASPYELVGFKPFFVQLNLPYSMVRNEQVMLSATVYNFGKISRMTRVYMKGEEGLCYDSREKEKSAPQQLRIKGNDAVTLRFPMIPLELGMRNVTVIAYTSAGGDAVTRPIRIEPEGIEEVKMQSDFIDPTSVAGAKSHELRFSAAVPADSVPGSESATFFITGDLLGPIVTKLLKNVEKALRNPVEVYQVSATETFTVSVPQTFTYTYTETYTQYYRTFSPSCYCNLRNGGCRRARTASRTNQRTGVRNVLRTNTRTVWRKRDRFVVRSIAPNVYVLRYLKRTNQLTEAVRKQAEGFIMESYRRLLGHRTKDGSFNIWGNTEAGTVWLTAFVAQNLQHASEFTNIDRSVICGAGGYLIKSQKATGAFLADGESTTKGMMGGTKGDPSLTAYVLISLMELRCDALTAQMASALAKAQEYLEKKLPTMNRVYDLAITSYALASVNSPKTLDVLGKLERLATFDKDAKTVHWKTESETSTIEATSYALLTLLLKQKLTYAKQIIKWLTQHRNAEGGFSSGQDTVVGLQAISAYASVQPALNLRVDVKSTADASFSASFQINKRNALVQEEVEVPVGGEIVVISRGIGNAEVQLELNYNIPRPVPKVCQFRTKYDVKEVDENGSYGYEITACVRNAGKEEIGTTVMEIGVLTGFVPIQESFSKMLNRSSIKRYELSDRAMIVYFDKIYKTEDVCITVSFKRAFDVGLIQPAPITVKDFLEQSISCTSMYSLSAKSPTLKKICKGKQCTCMQERCSPCQPQRMRRQFCRKDFVGIFKIKLKKAVAGWNVFTAKAVKTYRGQHFLGEKQVKLWVSSACRCPHFQRNRSYLIMSMAGNRFVLNDQSFVKKIPGKKKDRKSYEKLITQLNTLAARRC